MPVTVVNMRLGHIPITDPVECTSIYLILSVYCRISYNLSTMFGFRMKNCCTNHDSFDIIIFKIILLGDLDN